MRGVDIWRASLARSPCEVSRLEQLLDPVECARARRFRHEKDRRRFIVARGMLRVLLGEYTGASPECVTIANGAGGKPALLRRGSPAQLHFNLSHCGDLALFAFADREIGIDIERVVPIEDMERVAAHFFTRDEAEAIWRLDGAAQSMMFYRTWVRKEAYLKATGAGLSADPAKLSVADLPAGCVVLENADGSRHEDDRYSIHDLCDIDEHLAAVAVAGL